MRPGALRAVPNRHGGQKARGSGGLARPAAPRYKQYAPQPTRLGLRRFLRHLLSFCAVPALVLLLGEAVLQWSGEIWPIERVLASLRMHPEALFLRATDQVFYASKYRAIVERRPRILVAGSSRTMKFRPE